MSRLLIDRKRMALDVLSLMPHREQPMKQANNRPLCLLSSKGSWRRRMQLQYLKMR